MSSLNASLNGMAFVAPTTGVLLDNSPERCIAFLPIVPAATTTSSADGVGYRATGPVPRRATANVEAGSSFLSFEGSARIREEPLVPWPRIPYGQSDVLATVEIDQEVIAQPLRERLIDDGEVHFVIELE